MTLLDKYNETRVGTELLCKPLTIEDHVVQIAIFASPAKWHLAHTTWFFETFVLKPNLPEYKEFHKDFNFMFNSYYNNAGDRVFRADRGNMTHPTVDQVYNYRKHVDAAMQVLIGTDDGAELQALITLGINHEQQHQELLLTDIKYMLGHNPLFPIYDAKTQKLDNDTNVSTGYHRVAESIYEIGYQGDGFFYDNEQGRHKVYLHDYEISKSLVTNGEYLEFINDGGYDNFNLWLDEGWSWVQANDIKAPLYWHYLDGGWHEYTLRGIEKIQENQILKHISFYEAAAFAEWKSMRLATEYEWEVAADSLDWGRRWEWTNSAYLPYPGFSKAAGALGEYNGKFMINQMVLRGASIATAPGHSRSTYRNFFQTDTRWQYTGIRLVK